MRARRGDGAHLDDATHTRRGVTLRASRGDEKRVVRVIVGEINVHRIRNGTEINRGMVEGVYIQAECEGVCVWVCVWKG